MTGYAHPRLKTVLGPIELIGEAGAAALSALLAAHRRARRRKQRRAPRSGPSTPLWLALAAATSARLTRRGAKAQLARYLGVPRQRVHDYFVACTVCPGAEVTLRLLAWHARETSLAPTRRRPPTRARRQARCDHRRRMSRVP